MSEYKVINLEFLSSFTQNNDAKMVRYIGMFLDLAPKAINQMKEQLANKDFVQLKTTAHSLKPQLGYMGIASVKETVIRIEEYADGKGRSEEISALIAKVDETCQVAYTELKQAIEKIS